MQHLEGSGTPVLYIGRTVLKVNPFDSFKAQCLLYVQSILKLKKNSSL
jgi:hypothetical protein